MPSSWRPSPGSHLGRLHPASFVTRWLGTRGRMRNAPSYGGEARPAPRGASLATRGSRGPTRSPGVGHPPQVSPARVADPSGSPRNPRPSQPTRPAAPPHPVTHRLPGSYPHRSVPLGAASRCRKRHGPARRPQERGPDARPRPEAPASASVSLAAWAAELRGLCTPLVLAHLLLAPLGTPKFILAARCGPGQTHCSSI